jgi:hypothetical protein
LCGWYEVGLLDFGQLIFLPIQVQYVKRGRIGLSGRSGLSGFGGGDAFITGASPFWAFGFSAIVSEVVGIGSVVGPSVGIISMVVVHCGDSIDCILYKVNRDVLTG